MKYFAPFFLATLAISNVLSEESLRQPVDKNDVKSKPERPSETFCKTQCQTQFQGPKQKNALETCKHLCQTVRQDATGEPFDCTQTCFQFTCKVLDGSYCEQCKTSCSSVEDEKKQPFKTRTKRNSYKCKQVCKEKAGSWSSEGGNLEKNCRQRCTTLLL